MQLILFTAHYPFGSGEEFLEDEIRVAEKYFESITIVTMEKNPVGIPRFVPENTKVVAARKNMRLIKRLISCFSCLFRARVWKELVYAKNTTAYPPSAILKRILIQENAMGYVRRSKKEWTTNALDSIYYTYWLGEEFSLCHLPKDGMRISRAHGGDCFFERGYHPYRKESLKNLDMVFPISEAGRNDIVSHYAKEIPGLDGKLRTSRLGIAIPKGSNPSTEKKVKTIVSCSNVIQLKRIDLLIDALYKIDGMEIEWIHFGTGDLYDQIVQYAGEKLGDKKNIYCEFKGYTKHEQIMKFYESYPIDLFINCSDVEGIPVSVMEAMAFGIPAIGRDVGGMRELLDGSCGALLPENVGSDELSAEINRILTLSGEICKKLRWNARLKIESNYDMEKNYKAFYDFLKEELEKNEN